MISLIRQFLLRRRIRNEYDSAIREVYSENFEIDSIMRRLAPADSSPSLLQAYVIIRCAAETKFSPSLPLHRIVGHVEEKSANAADSSLLAATLRLAKTEAERALAKARIENRLRKIAYENDEFSYEGIVYKAEETGKRPLTAKERQTFKVLADQYRESENAMAALREEQKRAKADAMIQAWNREGLEAGVDHEELEKEYKVLVEKLKKARQSEVDP